MVPTSVSTSSLKPTAKHVVDVFLAVFLIRACDYLSRDINERPSSHLRPGAIDRSILSVCAAYLVLRAAISLFISETLVARRYPRRFCAMVDNLVVRSTHAGRLDKNV